VIIISPLSCCGAVWRGGGGARYTRPLGAPLGRAVRRSWGVWTRSFEHVDVRLEVGAAGEGAWRGTLAWH
jgi:hypothetical protein